MASETCILMIRKVCFSIYNLIKVSLSIKPPTYQTKPQQWVTKLSASDADGNFMLISEGSY